MTSKSATIRMPQRKVYPSRIRKGISPAARLAASVRSSLRGLAALLILLLFLGLSVYSSYRIRSVAQDITMLEQQYSSIQKERSQLSARLSALVQKERLVRIGKRLDLHPPGEGQTTTLP